MGLNEGGQPFPETRWSLIQEARGTSRGLEEWCENYWSPVREYLRALGCKPDDADEIAQKFFQRMLMQGPKSLMPENLSGSFRAYLKRAVKNYLIDCKRAESAQTRGGHLARVDFDLIGEVLPSSAREPDKEFDRLWSIRIMELALGKLRKEAQASGREDFFAELLPFLDGRSSDRSGAIERLGMNEGSFRAALYRYRRRYRTLIEAEVRETVGDDSAFSDEMRHFLGTWT
ncbi:hypothetical protein AAFN60_00695 [Roseibacillus persicicus]|uniref:RNA polymerase sigma factor n=1 Tax=Roseibacillus persicicus TaxID=454148 RepID=UPI00398B9A39